jgi:hypothetical protein
VQPWGRAVGIPGYRKGCLAGYVDGRQGRVHAGAHWQDGCWRGRTLGSLPRRAGGRRCAILVGDCARPEVRRRRHARWPRCERGLRQGGAALHRAPHSPHGYRSPVAWTCLREPPEYRRLCYPIRSCPCAPTDSPRSLRGVAGARCRRILRGGPPPSKLLRSHGAGQNGWPERSRHL